MFAYTAFSVNSIHRIQSLVCDDFHHYFKYGAIGAFNQSIKLDLTFSIGFILYFLIDGKWLEVLLIFASFHCTKYTFLYLKAEEHARIVLTPYLVEILSILCDVFRMIGVSALCIEKM